MNPENEIEASCRARVKRRCVLSLYYAVRPGAGHAVRAADGQPLSRLLSSLPRPAVSACARSLSILPAIRSSLLFMLPMRLDRVGYIHMCVFVYEGVEVHAYVGRGPSEIIIISCSRESWSLHCTMMVLSAPTDGGSLVWVRTLVLLNWSLGIVSSARSLPVFAVVRRD